jgi:hypothetical protein
MGNRELNKEIYRNTSLLKIKAKIQGQIGLVILYTIVLAHSAEFFLDTKLYESLVYTLKYNSCHNS